jgi:formylglycine-generating enzyme required for sulfatase activity
MCAKRSDDPGFSLTSCCLKMPAPAAARCERGVAASLSALLALATSNCIAESVARDAAGQNRLDLSVLTREEERLKAATPGAEFKECASGCPVMVVIPAGRFAMGSAAHQLRRRASEGPRHEVEIGAPFAVSKFEATFEEWDACVAASACVRAADEWGRGNMPVVNVSWDDAQRYLGWLSRKAGKPYRLLTEAEWEYAARAGTNTHFSWGNEAGANNANCDDCRETWNFQAAPVGSFKPNAWGLYDMHGNVWEWVEDMWHDNFDGAPIDGSAWLGEDPYYRVIRGGSWHNESELIRTAVRFKRHRHVQFDTLGFRVARTMQP